MKIKTGMTSVTFRKKSAEDVIAIVKEAGLDGIEWGGDIHVPAGDLGTAERVRESCRQNGIEILSYGSYYRAGEQERFRPVLETAIVLGAQTIRVWAGTLSFGKMPREELLRVAARLREDVSAARTAGITVALEYHRGTLTETKEGAAALLDQVPGLFSYWQPNPDISHAEQLAEIGAIASRLSNIHVFQWDSENRAHLLLEGEPEWKERLRCVAACPGRHDLILEFVKDGSEENFLRDAAVLRSWAADAGRIS